MGAGKIIILVLFFLISIPLIILTLVNAKDEGASASIMGDTGGDSGYGNKKKSKDTKMDMAVRILFGLFLIVVLVSYFI